MGAFALGDLFAFSLAKYDRWAFGVLSFALFSFDFRVPPALDKIVSLAATSVLATVSLVMARRAFGSLCTIPHIWQAKQTKRSSYGAVGIDNAYGRRTRHKISTGCKTGWWAHSNE